MLAGHCSRCVTMLVTASGGWLKCASVHGRLNLPEFSEAQGHDDHCHHAQHEDQSFCHWFSLQEKSSHYMRKQRGGKTETVTA